MNKNTVIHFQRKRRPNSNFSIEGIYSSIRNQLKDLLTINYVECPFYSNGVFRRLLNCLYATFKQGTLNHITGDVNYLNLFFNKNQNIITIHDCGLLYTTKGVVHQIYKYFWFTLPIKRTKLVIAVSKATKNEIIKYLNCNPNKIEIIYVPVSPLFKRSDKSFNKERPVILHIGTAPNKNLSRLITAVSGLSCLLVIIGHLNENYIKELTKNKIDYMNYENLSDQELYEQYTKSDILFFASTYEGFGMPIVEANKVGRPVITSNLLSMPEVAAESALYVNPFSVEEIRTGILQIINDERLRESLINKGFTNAERFSLNKIASNYFELYQRLIKEIN